jgi:hypothetical protein
MTHKKTLVLFSFILFTLLACNVPSVLIPAALKQTPAATGAIPIELAPTNTPIPPKAVATVTPVVVQNPLPVYPNAQFVKEEAGVTEYVTYDTFEQVSDFYHRNLVPPLDATGWVDAIMGGDPGMLVQCSSTTCEGFAILKKTDAKGDHEIQITLSENADKSVRITLGYFDFFVFNATPKP